MAPAARTEVIRGVRDLALRRGWNAVEDLAAELLSADDGEPILLLPGAGIDAIPLRAWIQQLTGRERIAQLEIERLAAAPHRTLAADKLIAVFDCGRPLGGSEVRALLGQFRPRPLETCAIVFTRAERLETPADLELAERTIWRVFGPDSSEDWRGQDLLGCQCYLWTCGVPRDFLRERCARDRTRLAALLRRRTGETDIGSLERLQVTRLLELANAHLSVSHAATSCVRASCNDSDLFVLRKRCEEIAKLRRRLTRRLEDGIHELGRAAVATLLQSQREIVRCLEAVCTTPVAARNVARALSTGCIESRASLPPLEAALRAWHGSLEAELNEQVSALAAETSALLQQARCAAGSGPHHQHRPAEGLEDPSIEVRLPTLEHRGAARVDQVRFDGLFVAEVAALTVVGVTALSPGAFAAFIVSAVMSASLAVRRTNRTLEHSRRLMRLAIHDVTERAVPEVRTAVQAAIRSYGERLLGALRKMEAELEAACDRARLSQPATPLDLMDRRQLLEYRCRL